MARTAMVDAGPSDYPCGISYAGNVYWHEKSMSADGSALSAFIETADMYFDINYTMKADKWYPDFGTDQVGAVYLTIYTRLRRRAR
jgi:hypothetical protein